MKCFGLFSRLAACEKIGMCKCAAKPAAKLEP